MAVQKQDGLHTDTAVSGSDLTGKEYLFCTKAADGTVNLSQTDEVVAGVISEGKAAGYHTSFNLKGNPILKVYTEGNIARNALVNAGANGKAKSGSTNAVGRARNAPLAGEMVEIEQF